MPPALTRRYPLIPWPRSLQPRDGHFAVGDLEAALRDGGAIRRAIDPEVAGDEAYVLDVTPEGAELRARTERGMFYGIQTLRQLLRDGRVPAVRMEDSPRFAYRGLHLDVSRHFFPVDFIKKYIRAMATFKINTFHWHLTDDQGWRLEIQKYPRLTEVGAWRKETRVGESRSVPAVYDGKPHGGFYTQAEAREVVAYARQHAVRVIPEIEMPGHTIAALAAYPDLACTPGPFEVRTTWGISEEVLCPSERTFAFLEDVLREVMAIFPSEYIHIGGDEAPKTRWKQSAPAQDVMKREGLEDEEELQSWFVRRIERFLNSNGRRLVGWDEILEGGLAPNATVMSWRGTAGGIAAAREGHDVVMCPEDELYFDHYQGDPAKEPLAIHKDRRTTLEEAYAYEPVPSELTPEQARHVLGPQGCVWTEYMPTSDHVEYMAYPRVLALAELGWTQREDRDWESFQARLPRALAQLEELAIAFRRPD